VEGIIAIVLIDGCRQKKSKNVNNHITNIFAYSPPKATIFSIVNNYKKTYHVGYDLCQIIFCYKISLTFLDSGRSNEYRSGAMMCVYIFCLQPSLGLVKIFILKLIYHLVTKVLVVRLLWNKK